MGGSSSQMIWRQTWGVEAEETLRQTLAAYDCAMHELPNQQWDSAALTIGGVRDYKLTYLSPAAAEWSSAILHLGSSLASEFTAEISRSIWGPCIVFFDFEQDMWGYELFFDGVLADRFWDRPGILSLAARDYRGDAERLARTFAVRAEAVAPYLKHMENEDGEKAFPDDEFPLGDPWVRVDFMRRLGLIYPELGERGVGRYVQIKASNVEQP